MTKTAGQKTKGAALAGVVGATAAGILLTVLPDLEDVRNDPYKDMVGVWTVCAGETNVEMRHYSDEECLAMLDRSLVKYAKPVLHCVPQLKNKPYQLAASVMMAYNVGTSAYCTSQAAKQFRLGNDAAACDLMSNFNKGTFPKGVKPPRGTYDCKTLSDGRTRCSIRGLDNRRKVEIDICKKGL
jgi:lysozyme